MDRNFEDVIKDLIQGQSQSVQDLIGYVLRLEEGRGLNRGPTGAKEDVTAFVRKVVPE